MDPSQQHFITWLLADWRRAILWAALLFVPLLLRQVSVRVGKRDRPKSGEPLYRLWQILGRLSGAVWADAPGSIKPILGAMPPGRLTPEGGYRAGDTPPQGSGAHSRVTIPGGGVVGMVLPVGCLFLFTFGCGASAVLSGMKAAEGIQEEAVKRQAEETDALLKTDYFLCIGWTHRYTVGAQGVLLQRAEVAKGTTGATEALSQAESLADKLRRTYGAHCDLAQQTSVLLKGVVLPEYKPPAAPAPPGPAPASPAAPAPPTPSPAVP